MLATLAAVLFAAVPVAAGGSPADPTRPVGPEASQVDPLAEVVGADRP